MEFTLEHIEQYIQHIVSQPLTCASAEKLNILCEAMRNMEHVHREFTEEDAEAWIAAMDPPARWTKDQTTAVMHSHGYHHKPCEFWVVMNALFSDYGATVAKHKADYPDFWAEMAHDFIDDHDAVKDKVGKYWRDIVRKS